MLLVAAACRYREEAGGRARFCASIQGAGRILGVWLLTLAASLQACPICDTGTGQQVRAGIFDENFWGTLITVLVPFPVLLLLIAAYHFGFPKLWNRPSPEGQTGPYSTHNEHHGSPHQ